MTERSSARPSRVPKSSPHGCARHSPGLVEGDSEKQVVARLGVSRTTAHQYVTALYRYFGVRSRGQLLAHILKRVGRAEWRRSLNIQPSDRRVGQRGPVMTSTRRSAQVATAEESGR